MNDASLKGLIFDIQGHSVHDGPGTRTLIFLSRCPLRCAWCSNPEGQHLRQRLMFKGQFCRNCPRRCIDACPRGAIHPAGDEAPLVVFDHVLCETCDSRECIRSCYMRALQVSGKWYTISDVMRILNRDRSYWSAEGGVTLSGGEPLLQRDFVTALLRSCRDSCISACVETTAHVPLETLSSVLPYLQWIFVDLKHMDTAKHHQATGVGNELILSNVRWLAQSNWTGRLVARMAVIPRFNDSEENAVATAGFMKEVGLKEMNLLPFHRLGASKHEHLGLQYAYADQPAMPPATLRELAAIYQNQGISCHVGTDTPY